MGLYSRLKNKTYTLITSRRIGDVALQQQRALMNRLQESRGTVFAKEYGLERVNSVAAYQKEIPALHYSDMEKYWQREAAGETGITLRNKPVWFGLTTGTTGKKKLLPLTDSVLKDFRRKGRHALSLCLRKHPDSKILDRKILFISGMSRVGATESGIPFGLTSGIICANPPAIAKRKLIPSKDLVDIQDWSEKARRIAEQARGHQIGCIFGIPPSVLDFLEKLKALYTPTEFRHFTEGLEALCVSAVNYRSYQDGLHSVLGKKVDIIEYYIATEGWLGHQSLANPDAIELYTDHIFYEFIPFADYQKEDYSCRRLITELSEGEEYTVVITPGNGAFSYVLGDVIECLDSDRMLFRIKGRTVLTLNMAGEKTPISAVEDTVNRLCRELSIQPGEYFLTGRQKEKRQQYLWVFEENESLQKCDMDFLSRKLDEYLFEYNNLYKTLYYTNFDPCRLMFLPRDHFLDWLAKKKVDRGQTKIPRIITNPEVAREIIG